MFVINTPNAVEYKAATDILAQNDVYTKIEFFGERAMLIVNSKTGEEGDYALYMCEQEFMMNFRQAGNLCPVCLAEIERTGEGDPVCGHLTFTTKIKPAF